LKINKLKQFGIIGDYSIKHITYYEKENNKCNIAGSDIRCIVHRLCPKARRTTATTRHTATCAVKIIEQGKSL
jgi:hypothetical protein